MSGLNQRCERLDKRKIGTGKTARQKVASKAVDGVTHMPTIATGFERPFAHMDMCINVPIGALAFVSKFQERQRVRLPCPSGIRRKAPTARLPLRGTSHSGSRGEKPLKAGTSFRKFGECRKSQFVRTKLPTRGAVYNATSPHRTRPLALGGNRISIVTLAEMANDVKSRLTTTVAASAFGRTLQLVKAAGVSETRKSLVVELSIRQVVRAPPAALVTQDERQLWLLFIGGLHFRV